MPWISSIIPRAMLPLGRDERRAQRLREDAKEQARAGGFARALDQAELSVHAAETGRHAGDPKAAASEEGHEEHEATANLPPAAAPGRCIDLEG